MKILELLLPKSIKNNDLSPKHARQIDNLQQRMNKYVDKIGDPSTTDKAREFLKAKLKQDYNELKDVIETVTEHIVKHGSGYRLVSHTGKNLGDFDSKKAAAKHEGEVEYFKSHPKENIDENDIPPVEPIQSLPAYEVVDSKTGKVMGKPYNSRSRARGRADKLDNEYGAYRYQVRKVGGALSEQQLDELSPKVMYSYAKGADTQAKDNIAKIKANDPDKKSLTAHTKKRIAGITTALRKSTEKSPVNEAVHKLPLTDNDFDLVKQLMCHPIPAIVAPIYLQEIFNDDEFNDMLQEWEETNPSMDVRPQVVEWFKRVMPDQMHRFTGDKQSVQQKMGLQSVIHGYDPHMYHGSNETITGDAYGRYN